MKQFNIISLLLFGLLLYSCGTNAQDQQSSTTDKTDMIEVIDFHSTHRCATCNAIEDNTKYTLETYFPNELESGKITFQAINVDEDENIGIAEKFEAYGTALFLNVISKGKEVQVNLTDFAFLKGRNQDKFSMELKLKIEEELSKL
ncbi:MAG: hypothetical protein GY751_05620 [Bacteroidetes bacterium]|nr:hypothetical protein [Bacteroidota bacterium]